MADRTAPPDPTPPPDLENPRGTLAIVTIFGVLFALGWIGMYLFVFLRRGALHS